MTPEVWEPYGNSGYFNLYFDMVYLRELVWPSIRNKSRNYEAFNCMHEEELGEAVPWPSRREWKYYVGIGPEKVMMMSRNLTEKWVERWTCPDECRPEEHKDWQFITRQEMAGR